MSGAHCPNFPVCMNVSDKPQLPTCSKPGCPGKPNPVFTAMFQPMDAAANAQAARAEVLRRDALSGVEKVIGELARQPDVHKALAMAVRHIEHMAAWITKQNAGYSFESLGEDMPAIRSALPPVEGKSK